MLVGLKMWLTEDNRTLMYSYHDELWEVRARIVSREPSFHPATRFVAKYAKNLEDAEHELLMSLADNPLLQEKKDEAAK
jgi:hypothetical protein